MTYNPVRIGVIGLGRAFMLMLPAFTNDNRVKLVAACAPREESLSAFSERFGGKTYHDAEEFCSDPDIEAIYIATPHQMHAEHTLLAAKNGKHVLVDKPISIFMTDGEDMINACENAGVHLIIGPSHSFDAPVLHARALIESGELGQVRMINAFNYTDFLYRPRRPEELKTQEGGGVIFSQAVHQIDIIRLLAGGVGKKISAMTGNWDPERPTEGAYSALLSFDNGAFASLTYSGYAYFDSDEWMDGVNELGSDKNPDNYGAAKKALKKVHSPLEEAELKKKRTFSAQSEISTPNHHEHFGPIIVSCDHGDIRLTPDGIWIYTDEERRFVKASEMPSPRSTVIDALEAAVRYNRPAIQSGKWGLASLEICHAILESAQTGNAITLAKQVSINNKGEYHE